MSEENSAIEQVEAGSPTDPTQEEVTGKPCGDVLDDKEKGAIPQITKELCKSLLLKARVLVVDDIQNMRYLIAKAIAKNAAGTSEAQDGLQALELLRSAAKRRAPYDVVMMDLMMPRMNGMQALQQIREDVELKDTPVILVTSRNDIQSIKMAMKLGISGYIVKPYRLKEVLQKVGEVLATVHLEKQKLLKQQEVNAKARRRKEKEGASKEDITNGEAENSEDDVS